MSDYCSRWLRSVVLVTWLVLLAGCSGGGSTSSTGSAVANGGGAVSLQSATVAADGRVLQLTFAVSPVPSHFGVLDARPGVIAGATVTLSNGAPLEYVGGWAATADYPEMGASYDLVPQYAATGGSLAAGTYWVAYSLVDGSGNEVKLSPSSQLTVAAGNIPQVSNMGGYYIPAGYSINLYLSAPNGTPDTLALYRNVPAVANVQSSVLLDTPVWRDPSQAFPGYNTLTWHAQYLITDPAKAVLLAQSNITVSGSGGLLQDSAGNRTAAFSAHAVTNLSLIDASGFTAASLAPPQGAVVLYVSSSQGNDSRTFMQAQNPATPLATGVKAFQMLNNNGQTATGAAIRFLRGDTFFNAGMQLRAYGPDPSHPMILEDYWYDYTGHSVDPGTRPLFTNSNNPAQQNAFNSSQGGQWGSTLVDNVLIRRLAFQQTDSNGGGAALSLLVPGTLTLDDLLIQGYGGNVVVQYQGALRPQNRLTVMRSIIIDAHDTSGAHTQGMFLLGLDSILLSQNIIDNNGHVSADLTQNDIYSHNVYLQVENQPAIAWGNLVRQGGSHGIQFRPGGVAAYNVFSGNAIASFQAAAGGGYYKNVIEKTRDISPGAVRGQGLLLGNGVLAEKNIIVNTVSTGVNALALGYDLTYLANPVRETIVRNNTVYNHGLGLSVPAASAGMMVTQRCNVIATANYGVMDWLNQNAATGTFANWFGADFNVYWSTSAYPFRVEYTGAANRAFAAYLSALGVDAHSTFSAVSVANPTADMGSYYASIGGVANGGTGLEASYITLLRSRPARTWAPKYQIELIWPYYAAQYAVTAPQTLPSTCSYLGAGS